MRPSDLALDFGNPVAYYPGLVKYLGSVNAVLMFCQFFYLSGKESSSLGIYKSVEEIETETGLSYREQVTARKQLASRGVLIETHKRLEHKIYFRIDADRLDEIITGNSVNSRNAQSAIGESGNSSSVIADCDNGGEAKAHFDPTETTTKNTTENIDPPNPQTGEGDEKINSDAKKALEFYNEQTGTRCRDLKPFVMMLTPTTTRAGYTLDELQLVIRWVLATWRRRGDSLPKPANICRVNRFDGYLADAEAWAVTETDIDPEAVMNGSSSEGATTWTGLSHLNGKTVDVVADGSVMPQATVTDAQITLSRKAKKIEVGLHYETTIQTLTPEISTTEGTTQNARKRTSEVTLRFMETTGAECNGQVIPFRTFGPKILNQPAPLFTGDHYFGKLGWERGEDTLIIQQRQPLPFHLLAIIFTFSSNGG